MTSNLYVADFEPVSSGKTLLPPHQKIRRLALGVSLLAMTAAGAAFGYHYWTVGQYLEETDDAYVKADSTLIAPKISGYIAAVVAQDNEKVKAGQILARLDDRDFRTALDQAKAEIAGSEAAIGNIKAQIALQQSVIRQSAADVSAAEALRQFAKVDQARYQKLMQTGYGTVQRAELAGATLAERSAQVDHDRAGLLAAGQKVAVLTTALTQAKAQRDRALAAARQAELNLSYTIVTAPVDGTVGARSMRLGQFVQAGTQLMAVIPLHAVYVVANFKETQLTNVRPGQPVDIRVDSFPGHMLHGRVDSLSPASGLEFSLLPPDNATGNFTKIVQRIPVKIMLDGGGLGDLLRPGMSVEPVIDTKLNAAG